MVWFINKKKRDTLAQYESDVVAEVKERKKHNDKVIAQSQMIADNFKQILTENGITIRIHAAAGGKRH